MAMSKGKLGFIIGCAALLVGGVIFAAFSLLGAGERVTETVKDRPEPTPGSVFEERTPHGASEPRLSETAGPLTVYEARDGLQLIEHDDLSFSVEIPDAWIIARDTQGAALKAIYQSEEAAVDAGLEIFTDDPDGFTNAAAWVEENVAATNVEPLYAGGFPGVRFVTELTREYMDEGGVTEERIRRSQAAFIKDGTLFRISCESRGKGYTEQTKVCERILESFTFF